LTEADDILTKTYADFRSQLRFPSADPMSALAESHGPEPVLHRPSVAELFTSFLFLGLIGFGGVLPLSRRMVVEQRRWMSGEDFTELLGLCQFLPGGNIINVAAALGMRFRGFSGALFAIVGLVTAPSAIAIALGTVYARFHEDPRVAHLFAGLSAAAAGLLVALAGKIALPLRHRPVGLGVAALAFIAIALLRLPFLPTMLALVAISLLATWIFKK
jgi:chromate transporter